MYMFPSHNRLRRKQLIHNELNIQRIKIENPTTNTYDCATEYVYNTQICARADTNDSVRSNHDNAYCCLSFYLHITVTINWNNRFHLFKYMSIESEFSKKTYFVWQHIQSLTNRI